MPLIQVTMVAGRTDDEKRELLAAITRATNETIGAPLETIRTWIVEVPGTELMVGGKTLAELRGGK